LEWWVHKSTCFQPGTRRHFPQNTRVSCLWPVPVALWKTKKIFGTIFFKKVGNRSPEPMRSAAGDPPPKKNRSGVVSYVWPPLKPRSGVVSFVPCSEKRRSGVVSFVHHQRPGPETGTGPGVLTCEILVSETLKFSPNV
jgi:hypothetical protein